VVKSLLLMLMIYQGLLACDMGGYQLCRALEDDTNEWILSTFVSYTSGAAIAFSLPVAMGMLSKGDQKCFGAGVFAGLLAVPVQVFVTVLMLAPVQPDVRSGDGTSGPMDHTLNIHLGKALLSLLPLFVIFLGLFLAFRAWPSRVLRGFAHMGRGLDALIKIVFVAACVEYFTGAFSHIIGWWGFDPLVADSDVVRGAEVAAIIAMMLCGALPFAHLVKRHLGGAMAKSARYIGMGVWCRGVV
jgi:ethanolamine transporter